MGEYELNANDYTGSNRPEINRDNLTGDGRLPQDLYDTALSYLRRGNQVLQHLEEGTDLFRQVQGEMFAFLGTLPKQDQTAALVAAMDDSLELKVTKVSVTVTPKGLPGSR